jgi:DNA repair protein RAD5
MVVSRWYKLIQKPFEEGDERGLKLVQAILRPLMLRRTKDSTDKEGRYIFLLILLLLRDLVICDP